MDGKCIVVFYWFSYHPSECTHIAVGGDGAGFRSIQDAVNSAEEGDTIEIQSGIYRENVEKSIKEENQYSSGLNMPSIVHFEIPVDDAERAKKFYTELFGWKIERFSSEMEYWMIAPQEGIGGGMMKRQHPDQNIMDYFGVHSVLESSAKVEKIGGKVLMPKMAVPNMGYFAVCMDTEGNVFGIWEEDSQAK